ncbi:uncharacterized protein DS421_3g85570 [Arachis hypogaea]|nr:uncharacterized protein DS421_3g85570 [Arachis hypogaea]
MLPGITKQMSLIFSETLSCHKLPVPFSSTVNFCRCWPPDPCRLIPCLSRRTEILNQNLNLIRNWRCQTI